MRPSIVLNARGPGILDGRQVRAMAFDPARRQVLDRLTHPADAAGDRAPRALVVGGGYSLLPAQLRDRGFVTVAVDSSPEATEIARTDTPGVTFLTAPPTNLGVTPGSFDVVYCADTLEVTDDLDGVLTQLAAAARPGAQIVLDTVTDTAVAKLIYLVAFPRLPFTRIVPAGRYTSGRLRNPRELRQACLRTDIRVDAVLGFEPASVISLLRAILDRRADRIADAELADAAAFRLSAEGHSPVVTYFALATRL